VVSPEGQFVATVSHELLLALELVPALASLLIPCGIGVLEIDRTLPGIVGVERQTLGELLRDTDLKRIEVRVLVVAVVRDVGIPAAGSRSETGDRRLLIIGVPAGWQRTCVIALQ
jgi:hypothetical protein